MGIIPGMGSDDCPAPKKNADLVKEFGDAAFILGSELSQHTNDILHVSPRIDLLIGGGIPGGSVVTLAGDPKCGKTVTALHMLGKAQQAGRPTFFINVEGRIKPRDLNGIACLDPTKLQIIRSYRDEEGQSRILKANDFLTITEKIIHDHPGAVIVIDSISQLVTSGEMENEMDKQDRAPGAKLMSKFCRRLANVIPVNDIILIGVLHFIANTSGFGKAKFASGGNKIKYAMDVGLECKKFTIVREGGVEDGKPLGQEVEWITTSTAFAPPGQRATSMLTFGIGIDELYETIDMGIEFGFIQQAKAWFTMSYMEDLVSKEEWGEGKGAGKKFKAQGRPKLVQRLRDNQDEREALEKVFREMMGVDE